MEKAYKFGQRGLLLALLVGFQAVAEVPQTWEPIGPGGGGALYQPSFGTSDPDQLYIGCDMSELFRSQDAGKTWQVMDFRQIQGGRFCRVQFTEDPQVQYALDQSPVSGGDVRVPVKTSDGGNTWVDLSADPTGGEAFHLFADPQNHQRLLISSWCDLWYSSDGGESFDHRYTHSCDSDGLHIGGVFFDQNMIFIGTNAGLLISTDNGQSFSVDATPGIPSERRIASFCAARQGENLRLYALIADGAYAGIVPEDYFYSHQDVYVLNWGESAWQPRNTGLPTTLGNGLAFIGSALNDIDTAYVAGQREDESPMIYKTTNGGTSWQSVLQVQQNLNIETGWAGHQGDRQWSYGGGTVGFAVAPFDKNRAAFTDYGFIHLTTDGGTSWRQAYLKHEDRNPAGSSTPKGKAYRSNGLEDTSCWWLLWSTVSHIFGCYTDIRGARTTDGGASWSFNYTGHSENTAYHGVRQPVTERLFLATSSVHDLFQSTYLTDSRIDGGTGRILSSADQGQTWNLVHDFQHPVIWLSLDPNQPSRMYASVVHSQQGGIYRTDNLQDLSSSTWTLLSKPPRTEGHPFNIHCLQDGMLACTYSGRRANNAFTASSGVFVSANGGQTWEDRSDPGMRYWTKDLVIDPHDPAQNTWYVGVFSGWGGPSNDLGGLYRSRNRGVSWSRILTLHRVTSCTIHPFHPNEMYVTSETEGLWHTDQADEESPSFEPVSTYPFRQPERVFFNPFDPDEIFVTSFGNGIRRGKVDPPNGISHWAVY